MSLTKAMELRRQAAKVTADQRALADAAHAEDREMTEEENASWTRMNDEYESLTQRAERFEELENREAQLAEHDEAEADLNQRLTRAGVDTTAAPTRGGDQARDDQYEDALAAYIRQGDQMPPELRTLLVERQTRDQATSPGSAGGYTVSEGFRKQLEIARKQFNPLTRGGEGMPTVLRTRTGNKILMPTVNDTGNKGEFVDENTEQSEQDVAFGQVPVEAYMASSKMIPVSLQLLQDNEVNLVQLIGAIAGERLGRHGLEYMTKGADTTEPQGIVNGATQGNTGPVNAITYDDFIDTKYSVDEAYQLSGKYMFSKGVLIAAKKLKDADGRPLWAPGMANGEPATIDGDGYIINQEMDDLSTVGNRPMLYGALAKFVVRIAKDATLVRLVERNMNKLQHVFLAYERWDSVLLDAGTNPIKFHEIA